MSDEDKSLKQTKIFSTKDLDVDRFIMSAGDIKELEFIVEEFDDLRYNENEKGDFGPFYTLECTTDKGPTALNISSKRLIKGLKSCLESIRGHRVKLIATGDGFSRHYDIEPV